MKKEIKIKVAIFGKSGVLLQGDDAKYQIPTGTLNDGERFEDAVRRIAKEHTGLSAELISGCFVNNFNDSEVLCIYQSALVLTEQSPEDQIPAGYVWRSPDVAHKNVVETNELDVEAIIKLSSAWYGDEYNN